MAIQTFGMLAASSLLLASSALAQGGVLLPGESVEIGGPLTTKDTHTFMSGNDMHTTTNEEPDWRSMDSAPRDGTVIEIANSYGIRPWYDLYRWEGPQPGEEPAVGTIGTHTQDAAANHTHSFSSLRGWKSATRPGHGLRADDEEHFRWRPYVGDPAAYVDPTNGAQETEEYWRGAAASQHDRPTESWPLVSIQQEEWGEWFAWYPVKLVDDRWAWLRTVACKQGSGECKEPWW
jgi:hypothetical protein